MKTFQIVLSVLAVAFISAACDKPSSTSRVVPVTQLVAMTNPVQIQTFSANDKSEIKILQARIEELQSKVDALEMSFTESFTTDQGPFCLK